MVFSNQGVKPENVQARMRQQMQADALRPIDADLEDLQDDQPAKQIFTSETIEEAAQFLRLSVSLLISLPLPLANVYTGPGQIAVSRHLPPW